MKKRKGKNPTSPFFKLKVFKVAYKYCRRCGRSITKDEFEKNRHACR